jgi:hypothetical protein
MLRINCLRSSWMGFFVIMSMWLLRSLLVYGYMSFVIIMPTYFAAPQILLHEFFVFEYSPQSLTLRSILAEPPPKMQKLDYDASEFKVINISPSKFLRPSTFRNIMQGWHGCKVYIHNRPIDFESVPLTLISLIFGHLSDNLFTNHENFLLQNFAPARDLANMLSRLEKTEAP